MKQTFATHRGARLSGLFLLYAAQGMPEGLLYVAVPAWLAANGASAEAISGYIAIILLPWSFKLVNGLLMDRVTYLPMGRRRPWVIAAQIALVLTLILFGTQTPTVGDLAFITLAGFSVNLAATFQDVAIDGMAIDVVPEEERARANGVMWGGKILGTALASVVTGILIARFGFREAAFVTATFVAIAGLSALIIRERPGERLLPWTKGEASEISREMQMTRWWPIASKLARAMLQPQSLLLAAGIFIALTGYGLDTAFGPVLAVQELGFSEERYGALAGAANLIGGLFGILLCGIIADRVGPRRALAASLLGMGVAQIAMAATPTYWNLAGIFEAYTVSYVVFFVLMSVSLYAEAMRLCTPAVAATQFSLFMAVLNLATSFGAQRYGVIEPAHGYIGAFAVAGVTALAAALLFFFTDQRSQTSPTASPAKSP